MNAAVSRSFRFGPYRVDTLRRVLTGPDEATIALTGKAFDVLLYLVERPQQVVSKDELMAHIWPDRVVDENNLNQAISALRKALGAQAGDHRYIVTEARRGYRFVGDVHDGETTGPAAPEPPPASETPSVRPARRAGPQRWQIGALAVLLLAATAIAVSAWRRAATPEPVTGTDPAQASYTLAILPFRALAGAQEDELLALGMAETLIARVSGSSRIRVRSLASSRRFAGTPVDPLDAARQLGAAYVVEGSTQTVGASTRVNARLLAVSDGSTLWSATFDEPTGRVFTLQDRIAGGVASALALTIDRSRARSPCEGDDPEAYRSYLSGRYQLDRPSAERLDEALAAFRQAIDRDPGCARAYAGIAYAYRALVMSGDAPPEETFLLAKAAVDRALAIDPQLAEAHASLGFIRYWHDWDWAGADASLRHAIALDPSLAEAHLARALLLSSLGRREQALAQMQQARQLDPLSPLINTLEAGFLAGDGKTQDAQARLALALTLEPDFWIALLSRGNLALASKQPSAAIEDLQRAAALSAGKSHTLASLGQAYVMDGNRAAAEEVLRTLQARDREGYVPATGLATVSNALGDTDTALDLLERAYRERDVRLVFLHTDSRWNNLRAHPRFEALLLRMKLPIAQT